MTCGIIANDVLVYTLFRFVIYYIYGTVATAAYNIIITIYNNLILRYFTDDLYACTKRLVQHTSRKNDSATVLYTQYTIS